MSVYVVSMNSFTKTEDIVEKYYRTRVFSTLEKAETFYKEQCQYVVDLFDEKSYQYAIDYHHFEAFLKDNPEFDYVDIMLEEKEVE